ncbi:carnitine dehydratase [Novosphingobium sp. TH158]|nr:carnitine dehydratase [Novosphingobium sp. TH158]
MKGIRILEVAQFTFVPAAGGILADWGADVIKIEHPLRGDTQRGFINMGGVPVDADRNPLIEHPNRGKRSVGIDLSTSEGQELLYRIAQASDVFLTNYLPAVRQKNRIDLEHIRAANPHIIYARGSAYGDKGPERELGGYDQTAFWSRSGIAYAITPPELEGVLGQGMPAFGDSIGGMNIAGGIAAALLHRERTGEALEVDVSLLSSAWWACGANITQGMETGVVMRNTMPGQGGAAKNPLSGNFFTSDRRVIALCMPSPGPFIEDTFRHLGLTDLLGDPRFANLHALIENAAEASRRIAQAFAAQPFAYWREHLKTMRGQWAPVQSLLELTEDDQALANDMVVDLEPADGGQPFRVVRGPVQFNREPQTAVRAPQANEHTETFLLDLGLEWDELEGLKEKGVIA